MKIRLVSFGLIEIDGRQYDHDVVIAGGRIARRKKGPSRPWRDEYGHTPLSAHESIPWSGRRIVIGTGAAGRLPIMDEVYAEARRRGVEIVALPTAGACDLLTGTAQDEIAAILHVTC